MLAYLLSDIERERNLFPMPNPEIKPHEVMQIYRKRKNITQLKIALFIHASQIHVSRIERGITIPDEYEKRKIEQLLGVRIWNREGV
ncbi:helix-turn-helix domain-containing protein [Aneurinibacillus tyrosinisolvens]|uniref:helix-turn-helix domain-containing protein n=1 Tax=Aneurinibacillus tyrosinisolvens TaxID=1443435 RepID=UPI000B23EDCE|nr:helix-turn-helix transcriptional regulator [Aneurinibacillus tyrosinisolvens]